MNPIVVSIRMNARVVENYRRIDCGRKKSGKRITPFWNCLLKKGKFLETLISLMIIQLDRKIFLLQCSRKKFVLWKEYIIFYSKKITRSLEKKIISNIQRNYTLRFLTNPDDNLEERKESFLEKMIRNDLSIGEYYLSLFDCESSRSW